MDSQTYISKVIKETQDIVISGMSGRFPESDTTDEFAENLYNKVDMITEDDRRWPTSLYEMNNRMGKIKGIDKFDGQFFGIMQILGDSVDPQSRILLETTYEAICDAGLNPQTLRGSETGVYIGYSSVGMPDGLPDEVQLDSETSLKESIVWFAGSSKCMYANRVSFIFDFKGPSMVIDTGCSASLVALEVAMSDIRLGKCNQAIVGGVNIILQSYANHIFQTASVISRDGISKVWDEEAHGFVRAEAVSCIFLQRKSDAKRIYATVLHSRVNIDGNKKMGMFFPSSEAQRDLMIKTYKEANVDPLKVNYFEAHGTGTKAGDPQEAKAIYNSYCNGRVGTLPIGLLKSNIGHAEGASGVASIVKVIIVFENECIPANLNLKTLRKEIAEMCPPLLPVNDNLKYELGIAAINNFGIGGVNAHILMEPNYKKDNQINIKIADKIPRLVNICGRTQESLNQMFDFIEKNPNKITHDFLALISDTMKVKPSVNSAGFPHRGYLLITKISEQNNKIQYQYKRNSSIMIGKTIRPVWFLFPGLGGQWIAMAKALMPIDIFANKIEECHQILKPFGIDLKFLLLSEDKNSISTMTNKFVATTAIQIAMFDVLHKLDIIADGIIGHSFGEIACAYADGCLTTEEALLTSYFRGEVTESDKKIPKGLMSVIGMSWSEAKKICPQGIDVVCNNSKDSVVISGPYNQTKQFINSLTEKNIFVRELESSGIPYHSQYLKTSQKLMIEKLKKVILNPKMRSERWISTAILDTHTNKEELKTASAEYFVHNLLSPVFFHNKLPLLPKDAIVVEIGPHGLFAKIVGQTLESSTYMSLIKKDQNETNLETFLTSIGKLYELGLNPSIENLYPTVLWPVSRNTQSISSLIKWDHKDSYLVKKYPEYQFRASASDMNITIDISQREDSYLSDHCIEGKVLFPATGYLMLAWRRLAASRAKPWFKLPVVFKDIQFRRPVFLTEFEAIKLKVRLHDSTGEFSILENNHITCFGKIYESDENTLHVQNMIYDQNIVDENNCESITLDTKDVYKELRINGYDYGQNFRLIKELTNHNCEKLCGKIEWNGNWVTFMDALLHTQALAMPFRKLLIPVMISSIRCDPKLLFSALEENKLIKDFVDNNDLNQTKDEIIDILESEENNDYLTKTTDQYIEKLRDSVFIAFPKYKSVLPFIVDLTSKLVITHGIEMKGFSAAPIPRRIDRQNLKLESYQFVPNEDINAIEENYKEKVMEYLKVCTSMAYKAFYLNKIDIGMESEENLINIYLVDIKEEYVMIKIFNILLNSKKDQNENIIQNERIMDLILDFQSKPEYDLTKDIINKVSKNELFIRPLLDIVSENNVPKKDIKVTEINLSYALMATEVDNYLGSAAIYPISVDYTLVNNNIENIDEEYKDKSYKFNEWNHEKNTFPLDLMPVDLVIHRDSHELWHLDLEKYLQEVYDTIVMKGFLLSVFRYKFTEPELVLNEIIGKNDFKISDLEQRIHTFIVIAKKVGFTVICRKTDSIGSLAILLRKVVSNEPMIPKEHQIIEINNNYEKWFELLKERIQVNKENNDNLWLIANDSPSNGILGFINCLRLEPCGEKFRCIFDYDKQFNTTIDFTQKPFSDILINDLAINVIRNGKVGTYRHLSLPKNYDQIETHDYFLNVSPSEELSIVKWFDSKNIAFNKSIFTFDNIRHNQIRCNVYSVGLNFREVTLASGRIMPGIESTFTDCIIGGEFAGRRTDTGERVCGFGFGRGFASFLDIREDLITSIPENWSMDDAVTVLVAYLTVWYALIERAQIRQNESILIHSGAGGVGQAAIAVCQYYNCDIFTTVGNEDKKLFLMKEYNIPENRIFSSRDTQFEYKIMSITKGRGVNIVLNSLSGDKLEASFECVSMDGRFVEIGKYDLQMNKQLGMFAFLRNISFIGLNIDSIIFFIQNGCKRFFDWMHNNSKNGCIKPINRTIFKATEAEQAFRYMTTGKHTGKIIIKIREEEQMKIALNGFNPTLKLKATVKTYFDPKKVYIITGGLGGMGLELMQWMLFNNARNIVLTSRYGVKSNYQRFTLSRLNTLSERMQMFKSNIIVSTHDSNTIEGSQQLLEEANKLGPIGGIFHLSLVLTNSRFENHSLDSFKETFESKVKTFENLDKLTRNSCPELDYFVVFSSVSCGKGNSGQTNYGFANSICERICELRRRDGLHGLAIQWGPIGDVGVVADSELIDAFAGVAKQRMNSCMEVLDKYLQCPHSILSSIVSVKRSTFIGTQEEKMISQLWGALGVDPKTTPNHLTLEELGMESMISVELQQNLERDYDIKLSLNDIKSITVKEIKSFQSGNKDTLKQYSADLKRVRSNLLRIKFIIPTETHTKLNSVQTGKHIYFLPPIEGIFSNLENLAKNIKRPVIGLNWTKETEALDSIKEISKYYINLLKKLSPNGNYDVVGYSFGAIITAKMLRKTSIGRAVIIDILSQTKLEDINEENIFDSMNDFIFQSIPQYLKERIFKEINSINDSEEKLKKLSTKLREFVGKGLVDKDLDQILENTYKRAKYLLKYREKLLKKSKLKLKFENKLINKTGRILVIKPFNEEKDKDIVINEIIESYYLPKETIVENLDLESVDSNSEQILFENNNRVAELLNQYLK